MALTFPKLTLPRLRFENQRIPAIAGAVLVVAAVAWFGWQYIAEPAPAPAAKAPPAPPAAKPRAPAKAEAPAVSAEAREKLIEDALVSSGLKQQLKQLPLRLMAGVAQSSRQQKKSSPAVAKAIETAVAESFTAQGFHDRVSTDLKKHFDQQRLRALLDQLSTTAAKRMIELAQTSPSPREFARFSRSAEATQPSPARADLIKRIDAATRASDLAIDVAFASMKGLALGMVGDGAEKAAAIEREIEKQRAAATKAISNETLLNLAFSLRDASEADLGEYARISESEASKWFTGIIYASILEEVKNASTKAGARIGELSSKPGKGAAAAKPVRSKPGADARSCLGLATNAAIIKCAGRYR